jgi:hypothetical protein
MYPHPKGYVCYEGSPKLTGRLDDPAWANAQWTDVFVDIEGDKKPKPMWDTRVKMLWDREFFYIGARLTEPHVWATLTEHDSVIFRDNDFEVFIDPDGDNHQYYEYEINALGTDWDLRLVKPYRDGGPALNEWEIPGLRKAVDVQGTINDHSDKDEWWGVELAFPWKVLQEFSQVPAPPRAGDQWRVNFSRVQWDTDDDGRKIDGRPEHNWVWSPQHFIDMHKPEFWGYVQFSHMPSGTDEFHPDPKWDARMKLIEVYYRQKAYLEEHKHWDKSPSVPEGVRFSNSNEGWQASCNGLNIRQDSLIWRDR